MYLEDAENEVVCHDCGDVHTTYAVPAVIRVTAKMRAGSDDFFDWLVGPIDGEEEFDTSKPMCVGCGSDNITIRSEDEDDDDA